MYILSNWQNRVTIFSFVYSWLLKCVAKVWSCTLITRICFHRTQSSELINYCLTESRGALIKKMINALRMRKHSPTHNHPKDASHTLHLVISAPSWFPYFPFVQPPHPHVQSIMDTRRPHVGVRAHRGRPVSAAAATAARGAPDRERPSAAR